MNIQKTILACAISAIGLVGCGTDEQDNSNTISGRSADAAIAPGIVVDGPVARATVFFDLNGNLKRDSFEPSALTDNDGYFNQNPLAGREADYCFGDTKNEEFCIFSPSNLPDDTQIIVTGGYDLYTGEPFEGSMSIPAKSYIARNALNEQAGTSVVPITPLSSIFANSVLDQYAGLFIVAPDFNVNYLNSAEDFVANPFAVTYQMHKFVTVASDWVKDQYPEIGENDNLPADVSSLIYKQFENLTLLKFDDAWTAIEADLNTLYSNAEVAPPQRAPGEVTAALADLKEKLADTNTAITRAFGYDSVNGLGAELTFANVKARMRGVEVVVLKIIRDLPHAHALDALQNTAYLANLAGDINDNGNINFTQIVESQGDANSLATEAGLASVNDGVSLSALAGKSLKFEDDDASINSKAAIFFTGTEGATKGEIHLCLQYNDDSDVDLDGNYISGTWDTIPALNNTVVLQMNIFGGMSAVLKKVGLNATSGNTEFRFDYAGEITKFNSADDFTVTAELGLEAIPSSNETCKDYLGINNQLQ